MEKKNNARARENPPPLLSQTTCAKKNFEMCTSEPHMTDITEQHTQNKLQKLRTHGVGPYCGLTVHEAEVLVPEPPPLGDPVDRHP